MNLGTKHALHSLPSALALLAIAACGSTKASPTDAAHDAHYDAKLVPIDAGHISSGHVDVLMQHNDPARTGQNLNETVLTQANVNQSTFGKLATLPVDGLIYAQPLIVTSTKVAKAGDPDDLESHDVLLVATMHNTVYAFDANTYATLWSRNLGTSVPSSQIGPINPETGLPKGTLNIQVEVGITATPVIDRENGYIYLTRKDFSTGVQLYYTHVLSLATGAEMPGSPVKISAQMPGPDGYDAGATTISFDATWQLQRPGLLLLNGTVYMAFASHEDFQPYHGWILGYTYSASSKTLTQTQVFNVTPDGREGGIWNSGQGLLSDGTSIYALTSNGTASVLNGGKSYGESFLKLSPDLDVQDWFVPYNYNALNAEDVDLGAGGPVLIPGTSPQLIVGGGKGGVLYSIDTTNMGHLGTVDDMGTQSWPLVPPPDARSIYGAPVVWSGSPTPTLFIWAVGDFVRKFALKDGLFDTTPSATTAASNIQVGGQDPVGNLAITSNGSKAKTGILWGVRPLQNPDHATVAGTFYAFNADDLTELWDSTQNAARDGMGSYAKFVAPTVANGKVYLATHSKEVLVYGLLGDAGGQ